MISKINNYNYFDVDISDIDDSKFAITKIIALAKEKRKKLWHPDWTYFRNYMSTEKVLIRMKREIALIENEWILS